MSLNILDTISNIHALKQSSLDLKNKKDSTSSKEFAALLAKFEIEVDRLAACLAEVSNNDPEIMQVLFELKSVVIKLRAENVETLP